MSLVKIDTDSALVSEITRLNSWRARAGTFASNVDPSTPGAADSFTLSR